jgi:multidrug resistance protein MdtO
MAAIAEASNQRSPFVEFLAVELAPREGRAVAVAHIATACAITVAIAMTFQIPEPTYMAYIVFLISKDERTATVTTAVGGQLAVTLAVVLTLGLMLVDLSEPALRVPAMALSTFVAMYTVRTFSLGPITYLSGFVIVMLQSVVDDVPNPETLTRLTLWMWVVLFVPIVITVVLNLLFGQSVVLLTQRTVRKMLQEMEAALLADEAHQHLARWREQVVALLGKQPHGGTRQHRPPFISVRALRKLMDALVILEVLPETNATAVREVLARRAHACRAVLEEGSATQGTPETAAAAHAAPEKSTPGDNSAGEQLAPAARAFEAALGAFQREIAQPDNTVAPANTHKRQIFVPDAFTNPAHWQFALKTTLAVMVVYFIYTMLDWPGMRTSIVTCFFVALGSLGETVHKLVLRLSGALIGGLIAGLCIVFVLPHMTDIGQLCLLVAVVSAGAAWVATSSELLAYAGLQIAFAFFLGILQDYAPATDLTVLRDRIAGIVLGNLVITLVFTLVWPESAISRLQAAVTEALGAISAVLKRSGDPEEARVRTVQALVRVHQFNLIRRFELSMLPKHARERAEVSPITEVERSAGEAFVSTYDTI